MLGELRSRAVAIYEWAPLFGQNEDAQSGPSAKSVPEEDHLVSEPSEVPCNAAGGFKGHPARRVGGSSGSGRVDFCSSVMDGPERHTHPELQLCNRL